MIGIWGTTINTPHIPESIDKPALWVCSIVQTTAYCSRIFLSSTAANILGTKILLQIVRCGEKLWWMIENHKIQIENHGELYVTRRANGREKYRKTGMAGVRAVNISCVTWPSWRSWTAAAPEHRATSAGGMIHLPFGRGIDSKVLHRRKNDDVTTWA